MSDDLLKAAVTRILNQMSDADDITEGIKEIYAEAKSNGFDNKAIRAVVKIMRADRKKLAEHEGIVEAYLAAIGELPVESAIARATKSNETLMRMHGFEPTPLESAISRMGAENISVKQA